MIPDLWSVAKVKRETHETVTLELEPVRPQADFSFAAGQFNMLYVFGVGEVPLSMSGHASTPGHVLHTVRRVGAVTRAISRLKTGAVVGVRGPFGSGWPVEAAAGGDVILIAGGVGIAPLRPAVQELLRRRQAYGRVAVVCGARSPRELLYLGELRSWRGRFNLRVEVTVDSASTDWRGRVGVVTAMLPAIDFDGPQTTAMVCGPEIMMRFAVRELQQRGVADDKIFLSMERNMQCAVGFCGHCQFGPTFICKDGPVLSYARIKRWFETREI